jgi:hypothetical protein
MGRKAIKGRLWGYANYALSTAFVRFDAAWTASYSTSNDY